MTKPTGKNWTVSEKNRHNSRNSPWRKRPACTTQRALDQWRKFEELRKAENECND